VKTEFVVMWVGAPCHVVRRYQLHGEATQKTTNSMIFLYDKELSQFYPKAN